MAIGVSCKVSEHVAMRMQHMKKNHKRILALQETPQVALISHFGLS